MNTSGKPGTYASMEDNCCPYNGAMGIWSESNDATVLALARMSGSRRVLVG
jgi:hypothetical protein